MDLGQIRPPGGLARSARGPEIAGSDSGKWREGLFSVLTVARAARCRPQVASNFCLRKKRIGLHSRSVFMRLVLAIWMNL